MEVSTDNMNKLKRALRENTMPLLTDEDLQDLLEDSDTMDEAIYKGAIMKSENTTMQVSGMSTADMSSYFLRLAAMHRPNNTGTLKGD
nr:MAG TPA: hypothetical protein [Caudoviricetes sp.]